MQASVTTHPPPIAQVRSLQTATAAPAPGARSGYDVATNDPFAQDEVVVERSRPVLGHWSRAQLAVVVGLCGGSAAMDATFLRVGFPVAFVIDPRAAQAAQVAELVRGAGQLLFVQVAAPPATGDVDRLRRSFGAIDGVAARDAAGMPAALRGTGLTFFDERGDASSAPFAAARVALVQRDVTADDRTGAGYVTFMLERAAALSRRTGPLVVLIRPLPSSLTALRAFVETHDVQMVALP